MSENKQYSHIEVEAKWTKHWLTNDIYKTQINKDRESFSIALPPPNVTGELHMGHALGGTIQDILIRYNRMLGKDTLWQIGTDHAGIGTQLVVEKDLKAKEHKRKEDIGREAFIARTQAWKEEYGNKIIEQMKVLGFSPDYGRIRYTMDEHYAEAVKQAFIKYFNDGLIYRGNRIVNWCPKCLTSLSDLEITKEECNKKLYEIEYKLNIGQSYIIVATTRPETMFGDVALAINPNDDRYNEIINTIKRSPGLIQAFIPFTNKAIPIILDEHVKTDFGTGALKVTPAHDANDYEIAQRHGLASVIIMDEKAKLNTSAWVPEWLQGLDRYKARELVLEKLTELGQINAISEYSQEKDLHDRCNTEIEPYLSDQWYLSMKGLAKQALEAESSGRVNFIPERYSSMFENWLENIQDWCISRQIWWGHRIPVYYYAGGCYAAEAPRDPSHTQDPDVLDTWFSSALWPFETLKDNEEIFKHYYPTDVLATAREIINLWVSRMIYSSEYFEGKEPFKDILIHPVVQTPDGKRMSKSKGNAIDPLEMVAKYGADASRMWYASIGIHGQQDVRFPGRKDAKEGWSSDTFEQYRKFANKLFNAAKFVMMQLPEGFIPEDINKLDTSKLNIADTWILNQFNKCLEKINLAYQEYDFATIQKCIYEFLWFDFCDWYIELSKIQLNEQILFYILEASLRVLHPIMPFISEELWQTLKTTYDWKNIDHSIIDKTLKAPLQESIAYAKFPQANTKFIDKGDKSKQMAFTVQVISTLRNARQSLNIAWSNPIQILFQTNSQFEQEAIENSSTYILNIAKAQSINQAQGATPKPSYTGLIGETQIVIPLAGLVDIDKLKSNIEKKISKLEQDIQVLEKRLNSDSFVNNAAPDKVEEVRNALEDCFNKKSLFKEELATLI